MKTAIFCTCGSNNWETVEDRWVHAARQFVSTEFSFHPFHTTFSVIALVASPGKTKMWAMVRENGDFLTVVNYSFITAVYYTIFAAIIDSFISN